MSRDRLRSSGWQGACLVGITYVYFLIFAQFAFLHRLAEINIVGVYLKYVLAAMAAGGILFSLLTPRLQMLPSPRSRIRVGLSLCGTAALLSVFAHVVVASVVIAFLIGAGLGILTVTLATHLRFWCGGVNPLFIVGLGTGIGYWLCNVPALFTAQPAVQAIAANVLCIAGILVAPRDTPAEREDQTVAPVVARHFQWVVACFAAFVWLDSAAFFIVQNTPALKAGTWQGAAHLWMNGFLHLGAAIGGAWILRGRGFSFLLIAAFAALGGACLLLTDPSCALAASVLYPVGVSLYSVALVAYPSLFSSAASMAARGRQAGWIYAIAGWIGSALGIGMGQNLGHVPAVFVAAAGAVILLPMLAGPMQTRLRELGVTAALFFIAQVAYHSDGPIQAAASLSPSERGRQVYISEGCISCHSQYVRPNTRDVLMWGPIESMEQVHRQRPPLIGNRRQGPDLSQIGGRRSPLWLKIHFFNPEEVSGASIMPSYGFLFADGRGDDLVAYLESLRGAGAAQHTADEQQWHLASAGIGQASADRGQRLYARFCATCHSNHGATRMAWLANFEIAPQELTNTPLKNIPVNASESTRIDRIAHIAKFGIPGTDMPGHEYLSDTDIASISLWLSQNTAQPVITMNQPFHAGDNP